MRAAGQGGQPQDSGPRRIGGIMAAVCPDGEWTVAMASTRQAGQESRQTDSSYFMSPGATLGVTGERGAAGSRAPGEMWAPGPLDGEIPAAADAILCEAWRLHARGRHLEAAAALEGALEICPTSAKLHYFAGVSLASAGHNADAIAALRRAEAIEPARACVLVARARALHAMRRHDEALEALGRAAGIEPNDAAIRLVMGATLRELERHGEALEAFGMSERLCPSYGARVGAGGALRMLGHHAEAVSFLRRAIEMDPSGFEAHLEAGKALSSMGDAEGALGYLGRAISIDAGRRDARFWAGLALRALGRDAEAQERFEAARGGEGPPAAECALDELVQESQNDPGNPAVHEGIGHALMEVCARGEALEAMSRAAALDPQNPRVHCNMAQVMREVGRPAEALEALGRALELDPTSARAYSMRERVLRDLGRDE